MSGPININELGAAGTIGVANDLFELYQPGVSGVKNRQLSIQGLADALNVNTVFSNIPYLNKANAFSALNTFGAGVRLSNGSQDWDVESDVGTSEFQVIDILNTKIPFAIESNSPTDSIRVTPTGVGILYSDPQTTLHLKTSTPIISIGNTTRSMALDQFLAKLQFNSDDSDFDPGLDNEVASVAVFSSEQFGRSYDLRFFTTNILSLSEKMRITGPGNVIINGTTDVPSAKLQIDGTNGAFLLPRLTTAERNALTPVDGMQIYNTTTVAVESRAGGAWV